MIKNKDDQLNYDNLEKGLLFIQLLINKRKQYIYVQLFIIIDKIIDISGYDLPDSYWQKFLQVVYVIIEFLNEKDQLDEKNSKIIHNFL